MFSPTAPLILPSNSEPTRKESGGFDRRHGVILISVLEMLYCLAGTTIYIYVLSTSPSWARILLPIPPGLCSATNILHGVMYILTLLFVFELFLSIYLLDGARRKILSRVTFWMHSMLIYLILVSIVVIGMELGGVRSPTMNSVVFINIFVRFIEIMIVYAWVEQQLMLQKSNELQSRRRRLDSTVSTSTIATMVEHIEPQTPPPSYNDSVYPVTSSPVPSTSSEMK